TYETKPLTDSELVAPADKVEKDGSTTITTSYHYELIAVPANASGTVVEGETTVVYVYKLVETVTRTTSPTEDSSSSSNTGSGPIDVSSESAPISKKVLPKTGQTASSALTVAGGALFLGLAGIWIARRRTEKKEK
ncbi:TPA: LPXTG cell wall anchor domain-containing protein, partial [Streptococcus suis]